MRTEKKRKALTKISKGALPPCNPLGFYPLPLKWQVNFGCSEKVATFASRGNARDDDPDPTDKMEGYH